MGNIAFIDKLLFTKHLSVMLKSGITLPEAIVIISEQTNNTHFKDMLAGVGRELQNGQSLYKALSKNPRIFDPLYLNLVKIGEESGNLDENLHYLAVTLRKNYEFKKKVQGAILYPELVLLMAFVVGGGISIFVLPQLIDLFKSMDFQLPLSTRLLIYFAQIMKAYGLMIFAGFIGLFFIFRYLINTSFLKPFWQKFMLSIPVLGKFIENVEISSFSRNLGMMLRSGLPILTALETQINSSTNIIYKDYIETIYQGVKKGKSIHEIVSGNNFKFFPRLAIKMIGVGEKTGKLDESLLYLADFFEDEVDSAAKDFSSVLEPVILLGVGLVVAYLALAIISPIYQFTGSIRR